MASSGRRYLLFTDRVCPNISVAFRQDIPVAIAQAGARACTDANTNTSTRIRTHTQAHAAHVRVHAGLRE